MARSQSRSKPRWVNPGANISRRPIQEDKPMQSPIQQACACSNAFPQAERRIALFRLRPEEVVVRLQHGLRLLPWTQSTRPEDLDRSPRADPDTQQFHYRP